MAQPIISLLYPTARLAMWEDVCQKWYDATSDPEQVELVIVTEWDVLPDKHKKRFPHTVIERNTGRPCLVDGFNRAAELSHGQVMVAIADDFVPVSKGWDEELLKVLDGKLDQQVVVWASTGGSNDAHFIVHPIMTRPYYEQIGYWFWPEYDAYFADNELNDVAVRDGVILDARDRLHFDHIHPSTGRVVADAVNQKQDSRAAASRVIYQRRKREGFPRPEVTKPLISLLHTTCRPEKWQAACESFYENADNPNQVEYVVVAEKARFENRLLNDAATQFKHNIFAWNTGRPCPIDGWNQAASLCHGKVLMIVADDLFATPHWDTLLLKALGPKIDEEAVVWVHADPNDIREEEPLMSHVCMTRPYYNRYGTILCPEYENWCSDVEITETAQRDGVIIDARDTVKFDHQAPAWTGEPEDKDNKKFRDSYERAKTILNRRRAAGYPRVLPGQITPEIQRVSPVGEAEPKLSILVCSVTRRAALLERLLWTLKGQALTLENPQDIEILYLVDNCEMSIGAKRNKLLAAARGQYACFVDDDDRVFGDYVRRIFEAMEDEPDCIGMAGIMTTNGAKPTLSYFTGDTGIKAPVVQCCHLSPIKREIAASVKFLDTSWGEDRAWAERVMPLLKKVNTLDRVIYHYDFWKDVTETQKPGTIGHVETRRYRHHIDDPLQALYELPDWAVANLARNESVPLKIRIQYARYLRDAMKSSQAQDPQIADLLVDIPCQPVS